MIAPTCIIAGLGMTAHFDIIEAPGATGDYHTNLESKFRTAQHTITNTQQDYGFGFIHIKAVDDAGHDKNVDLKVKFLTQINHCLGLLIQGLQDHEDKEKDARVQNPFVLLRRTTNLNTSSLSPV